MPTRRRPRRVAALTMLAAIAAVVVPGGAAAAAVGATAPATLTASFDRGAALGSATALDVDLRLDPNSSAQLTQVRFEYPGSLGLVSSGLGLATCTRPQSDFAAVLIPQVGLAGCPQNSVMGYGVARAIVRLTDGQVIPEFATVTVLSGPVEHGQLGLVVFVDGVRPFGAKLAFAGAVTGAPAPYGGALAVRMPVIPGIKDLASVSLVELRVVIGSHAIRYTERRGGKTVWYRPEGVELPASCPSRGFRFRARVAFADGSSRTALATTRCPSSVAARRAAR